MTNTPNCPVPDPCDPQTFTVNASSTYPPSSVAWEIEMSTHAHMYYQNVTYDLIAMLIARIGVEFSKLAVDGDNERIKAEIGELRAALNKGMFD